MSDQSRRKAKATIAKKVYEVISDHDPCAHMLFASKASAEECAKLLQEKYGAVYKDYLVTIHKRDLKP